MDHACMLSAGADRVVRAQCIASTVVVVAATFHVRPRVHVRLRWSACGGGWKQPAGSYNEAARGRYRRLVFR